MIASVTEYLQCLDHHWLEAFHIIAVTSWMVGLFYLPRLYVYHSDAAVGSDLDFTFRVMESRLLKFIMAPAALIAIMLGLSLALSTGHIYNAWLHLKFIFVLLLLCIHVFLIFCHKAFLNGKNIHSRKFFKILNEVVTVAFVIIVILAAVKPI